MSERGKIPKGSEYFMTWEELDGYIKALREIHARKDNRERGGVKKRKTKRDEKE